MRSLIRPQLALYLVMGSMNCRLPPEEVLTAAIKGGVTMFQYREKGAGALQGDDKLALGRRLRTICFTCGVPFIVNDDVAIALTLDADGVHIGQEDGSVQEAREKLGFDRWLGVSAHNVLEAAQAAASGADYLGVGPMFPTTTKLDCREVQGPSAIAEIRKQLPAMPIVGIGGITAANRWEVLDAGADGVAVVSAISQDKDPEAAARRLSADPRLVRG